MRSHSVVLKGRTVALSSGDEIHQWEEAGDDGMAVVSVDATGHEVGRVAAVVEPGHVAATVSAWTSPTWRRRGVAHAGVELAMRWAAEHDVPFLVTDVDGNGDGDADAFAHGCGFVVAARTDGAGRRLTVLVPLSKAPPGGRVDEDAFERALLAMEGGASMSEAGAIYRRHALSKRRHPSSRVA